MLAWLKHYEPNFLWRSGVTSILFNVVKCDITLLQQLWVTCVFTCRKSWMIWFSSWWMDSGHGLPLIRIALDIVSNQVIYMTQCSATNLLEHGTHLAVHYLSYQTARASRGSRSLYVAAPTIQNNDLPDSVKEVDLVSTVWCCLFDVAFIQPPVPTGISCLIALKAEYYHALNQ